jgi:hypothetical protein
MLVAMKEILHYFILLSVFFLRCAISCTRGTSGRGNGGTSTMSGITTTVNNPVTQTNPTIN